MSTPILIVEDEIKLAELMRDYLIRDGYEVEMLHRGDEVMPWLKNHQARLILLDLMLPGIDGLSLCREVRKNSNLPIIMATARVEEIDRLLGLSSGADDYICKPFSPREVCARVVAVLRRAEGTPALQDKLEIDEDKYQVRAGGQVLELTALEFRLITTLVKQPGRVFSRDQLMDAIYTDQRLVSERTIDSHVKKLRKKLELLPLTENPIRSIYGVGYKFD
ncbi:response regulator [Kangiella koreensis]|uniref:Two component transcriptional regulator, winged helix family n=1 Tax=Kangiella koreensis (strain DSM 16069 / JCM 12317 / KCTC 12182 / SW-125) TaxID=523791 RepID=C7R669_KANKD|nr:two component transcriptional regulator, winged helix family [Kangiella koreensis DSM 16069]